MGSRVAPTAHSPPLSFLSVASVFRLGKEEMTKGYGSNERMSVLFSRCARASVWSRSTVNVDSGWNQFGLESAHVGKWKGGPGLCLGWRMPCPHGLDPSNDFWAIFTNPVGSGQYQLMSWATFRLWAIFQLEISLSFSFLFSLLRLHSD
jgi:hypothetical protein